MRIPARAIVSCLGLSLAASGCEPAFGSVDLLQRTPTPEGVEVVVQNDKVSLPLGLAVAVWVDVESSTVKRYSPDDVVGLASENGSIMAVYDMSDRTDEWLLVGASVGETCLVVSINDSEEEDCVQAIVTDPTLAGD